VTVLTAKSHANLIDADRIDRAPPLGLTRRVVDSFDEATALRDEWDALVQRSGAPLYQTFDWCRVWWNHYGSGRALRLVFVHSGGKLVGIVPMFIERLGLAPLHLKVAKLLSSDFTLALCDPPVERQSGREVFEQVLGQLFQVDRCDAVHFGPITNEYSALNSMREACAARHDLGVMARDRECGRHTVFDLAGGFDGFLRGMSKNQRSNYKRNVNGLTKNFRFAVDVVSDAEGAAREFENFIDMHQRQWQTVGNLGHFADWPGAIEYHRELVRAMASAGKLRLLRMLADDEVVSYYFCFASGGTYYWRLPARKVGDEWDRHALGRVGLMKMLEVAAGEGATRIEAGNGWYEYKERLNATSHPLHSIVISSRSAGSHMRTRAALALADVIDKAYYRLWFSRVAPRLPLPRRGLRRFWIRRRF
jgi:CelD/BcsL family acetyltransferase involved in cellulose biosynthesis